MYTSLFRDIITIGFEKVFSIYYNNYVVLERFLYVYTFHISIIKLRNEKIR
jgi:hypothetical protein